MLVYFFCLLTGGPESTSLLGVPGGENRGDERGALIVESSFREFI